MAKFRIKKDGKVFLVEVAEGQDPNEALEQALAGEPVQQRPLGEEIARGTGLGVRSVVGAIPKVATGLADIGAGALNLIPAGLSKAQEAIGGEEITARLPTDATAQLDAFLDQFFPKPETLPEKIAVGTGEVALTGGAGGAALAPKVGRAIQEVGGVTKLPGGQGTLRGLGDQIGEFFAKSPKTFAATEAGGGVGAIGAGEVAQEADVGPLGTFLAQLVGGLTLGVAPQAGIGLSRRAATAAANFGTRQGAERRAATALQKRAGDPAAAAKAAETAPEDILPARAADEPGLRALEAKVLADDPVLAARVARDLQRAEERNLEALADDFGPGTSKQEWQTRVVQETAPEGTAVVRGQPDEMLSQSFRAFKGAYDVAKGHNVKVNVRLDRDGRPTIPEGLLESVLDPAILTGPEVRRRVAQWLQGRYAAVVQNARRTGEGAADSPVFEVTSDQLLELRHVIRTQQRAKAKAGATSADAAAEAELLSNADRGLTETINRALTPEASAALRATDAKYVNLKTVERAIRRSGDKGLTETALRSSIASRTPEGQVARGETGRLGELTEQGANVGRIIRASDVEAAERMVRTMNPTELQAAKGDFVKELAGRATRKFQGAQRLKGEDLLNELKKSRKVLKAAGFNDDDLGRIERVGRQLQTIQNKSVGEVTALITDNVGVTMRLMAAIAGSRAGTRVLRLMGGTTGAGPSLILAQFGSRQMQKTLSKLTVDKADELMRAALSGARTEAGESVMAALLTKPTDTIARQAAAARTIQAWLIAAGAEAADDDTTPADEEE